MAPRRSGRGSSSKHRDEYIPASAQGRGDDHPSSIAMSSIVCPEEKTEDLKNEKEELKDSNTNLKLIGEGTTSKDNLKNYIREKENFSKGMRMVKQQGNFFSTTYL